MAPPYVLDYLAAHETAHLRHHDHSERFWALTKSLCPQTALAEAWLKAHGAKLHRYGRRQQESCGDDLSAE
jgi:predicted metal-dependent hydrolase